MRLRIPTPDAFYRGAELHEIELYAYPENDDTSQPIRGVCFVLRGDKLFGAFTLTKAVVWTLTLAVFRVLVTEPLTRRFRS